MPDPCAVIDSAVEWTQCLDLTSAVDAAGAIAAVSVTVALMFGSAHLVVRLIKIAAKA